MRTFRQFLLSASLLILLGFNNAAAEQYAGVDVINVVELQNDTEELQTHEFNYGNTKNKVGITDKFDDRTNTIRYRYTLANDNKEEFMLFKTKEPVPYGMTVELNPYGLYLKEIRIEWGNKMVNTGSLFLVGLPEGIGSVKDMYDFAATNPDNIIKSFVHKDSGTSETFRLNRDYNFVGLGILNADHAFTFRSLTFVWTNVAPSSTTQDPNNPDYPDNPDTPDTPDVPDTPDTPDTPDVPDTPDTPDTPDVPDTPDNPDTPDTPDVPDTPDTPDNPDTPDVPDSPDTPDVTPREIKFSWCFNDTPLKGTVHREAEYMKNSTYTLEINGTSSNAELSYLKQHTHITVTCMQHSASSAGCFTIQGNKSVTLFHAGEFQMSAALDKLDGYNANEAILKTFVDKLHVVFIPQTEIINIPWSDENGLLDLSEIFEINYEGNLDDIAMTASLEPVFSEYECLPTRQPSSMTDFEWAAIKALEKENRRYDGFYDADMNSCVLTGALKDRLSYFVPCSGLYRIDITSADENIDLTVGDCKINIHPCLSNFYEIESRDINNDAAFSNGKIGENPASENERLQLYPRLNGFDIKDGVIEYIVYKNVDSRKMEYSGNLSKAILETPGLADCEIFYRTSSSITMDKEFSEGEFTTAIPAGFTRYSHNEGIDISRLTSGDTSVELIILKNGSATPLASGSVSMERFDIRRSIVEISGISCIESQESEDTEYFTLGGIRISPENLPSGLYIQRRGAHSKKIIVN